MQLLLFKNFYDILRIIIIVIGVKMCSAFLLICLYGHVQLKDHNIMQTQISVLAHICDRI